MQHFPKLFVCHLSNTICRDRPQKVKTAGSRLRDFAGGHSRKVKSSTKIPDSSTKVAGSLFCLPSSAAEWHAKSSNKEEMLDLARSEMDGWKDAMVDR